MKTLKDLQELYDKEINFHISCFWDGGIDAKLGDETNGWKAFGNFDTVHDAVAFLWGEARIYFPKSFKKVKP